MASGASKAVFPESVYGNEGDGGRGAGGGEERLRGGIEMLKSHFVWKKKKNRFNC
jgi:hypothetical protein